jgi:hypothetical protein
VCGLALFASGGHLIDLRGAQQIILACAIPYRLPEPTRLADLSALRSGRWGDSGREGSPSTERAIDLGADAAVHRFPQRRRAELRGWPVGPSGSA